MAKMAKKVFIGVGHGGKDPGAVANGFKEKELNLEVADAVFSELERHGVCAMLSRVGDDSDTLDDRVKECNKYKPDLAVDIHHNAGGGDGAEVYYHYKGGDSKTLAENILADIVKVGQNSRGAKTKRGSDGKDFYGFIRATNAPAVIVECAFVDNAKDMQIEDTAAERKAMGVAIAKGILKTLGVAYYEEKKPEVKPEAKPEVKPEGAETVYTVVKGDSLSAIAAKYGTTWQKLAEYNGIENPHILWIGQKIKIPGAKTVTYTVKSGDTLSAIAKKHGTTYQKIAKDNGISNPSKIYPGQKLVIKL